MLPIGMIEIRLKYVREQMKVCVQDLTNAPYDEEVKTLQMLSTWKTAEYELLLILGHPDVCEDDWLRKGRKIHIGKANRGELETNANKIYHRYIHEFGQDNSWYAQLICSWIHVAEHNTMPLLKDEGIFYKAYDTMLKIRERVERRDKGFYDCIGCRNEKNRYQDGYNMIEGKEYCDVCAKQVEPTEEPVGEGMEGSRASMTSP